MVSFIKMKLISPAIIGGADSRNLDQPPTIRIPQIRGQLRFWTRALAGARTYRASNCVEIVKLTEEHIFGGTNIGTRIHFKPVKIDNVQVREFKLFPHKEAGKRTPMNTISPDSGIITLKFDTSRIPNRYLQALKAVFWIWLHLGAIGKRSRRGFGSIEWQREDGDFLSDPFNFKRDEDLKDLDSLKKYLLQGLEKVNDIWKIPYLEEEKRTTYPFYCLRTIDQIFIGKIFQDEDEQPKEKIEDSEDGIIYKMHGISKNGEVDEWELGHKKLAGKKRQASPMMWRLYKLDSGYVPLMVWSPLKREQIDLNSNVYQYVNGKLGFEKSMMQEGLSLEFSAAEIS